MSVLKEGKEQTGDKKKSFNHKEPSAAEPQPKVGISRAKAQRPQRKDSELGVLGVLARE
jgi:hypothetical protein